jgi:hypothetical protein
MMPAPWRAAGTWLGLASILTSGGCATGGGAHGVDWSGVPRHAREAADSIYSALAAGPI